MADRHGNVHKTNEVETTKNNNIFGNLKHPSIDTKSDTQNSLQIRNDPLDSERRTRYTDVHNEAMHHKLIEGSLDNLFHKLKSDTQRGTSLAQPESNTASSHGACDEKCIHNHIDIHSDPKDLDSRNLVVQMDMSAANTSTKSNATKMLQACLDYSHADTGSSQISHDPNEQDAHHLEWTSYGNAASFPDQKNSPDPQADDVAKNGEICIKSNAGISDEGNIIVSGGISSEMDTTSENQNVKSLADPKANVLKYAIGKNNSFDNSYESCKEMKSTCIDNNSMKSKSNPENSIFKCDVCYKTFTHSVYLEVHLKAHNNKEVVKCDICNKTFSRSFNLLRHVRSHNGEKPYQCGVCSKSFTRTHHLQEHMRIHTGEKPYKCELCGETFTSSNSLTMHRRKHSGERPYGCDVCGKGFTSKSHLQAHIRIHSGEKPYKCGVCEKAFNQGSQLQQHMMTHTKEKPYKCDICQKSFSRRTYLHTHISKHLQTSETLVHSMQSAGTQITNFDIVRLSGSSIVEQYVGQPSESLVLSYPLISE